MSDTPSLPNSWGELPLGQIFYTTSGGTPSRKNPNFYKGRIPWVKSGELDKGVIYDTEEHISDEAVASSSAKIFPKGTLLIALYGATIGKLGFLGVDAATNQAICGIHQSPIMDLQFLKHFLFHRRQDLIEKGAGGAQPNISQSILKELLVVLPPLPEQHRIVAKIEELFASLDKGIEALKTAQQQLKVYRQAVLKYAFEGRLTHPDLKEGELPEGWVEKRIDEVAFINPKLPFERIKDSLDVTFLPMKNVEEVINRINLGETRKYSQVKKGYTSMIDGDVIFAKITPCMENGKIAVVHSLKNGIAFGSTEFHVIRCKKQIQNKYLFYFLVQERFRQDAERNMTGAVGQRRVPKKYLEDSVIPFPVDDFRQTEVLKEIETRLAVCEKIEGLISINLQQSEALRQSILKRAFEGKLVPQDPNDEPASVLLERIRAGRVASAPLNKPVTKKGRRVKA